MIGINLATQNIQNFTESEQKQLKEKKCIFLSHRSVDKTRVIMIGKYIMNAGFNIYLDINDVILQSAVSKQDAEKITKCIWKGLSYSNYVLCVISNNTFDNNSWWVPYEIGYTDKSHTECCLLKLDNVNKNNIPEFLKIKEILYNVKDLNRKLTQWSNAKPSEWQTYKNYILYNGILSESAKYDHVLVGAIDIE